MTPQNKPTVSTTTPSKGNPSNTNDYAGHTSTNQGNTSTAAILAQLNDLQDQVSRLAKLPTNLETDLNGLLDCVSTAPTIKPVNLFDQVKIYANGTTYRLYVYNWVINAWHYVALT